MPAEVVERAWWRAWVLSAWAALAAVLVHGWIRVDLLGGAGRPAVCQVVAGPEELLPADCWLPMGWLGVRRWTPAWADAGWRVLVVAAAAVLVGSLLARSAARRHALLVRVATGWLIGGVAATAAFERNVARATGAGPGWPLRVMGWAPLALAAALVFGFWAYSPWRTLDGPGLRTRRREAARRRAERSRRRAEALTALRALPGTLREAGGRLVAAAGHAVLLVPRSAVDGWTAWVLGDDPIPALPEVHAAPAPVRLVWPVPARDVVVDRGGEVPRAA